jgi:hypothetical protein
MRYEIVEMGAAVDIEVHDAAGQAPTLLRSMQDCAQGHCGCPTDQYERLAEMEMHPTADGVTLQLRSRPGQHLDQDALRRCLDYTLAQAAPQ